MTIKKYQEEYRGSVVNIWERSVRATHNFLHEDDIDFYKSVVAGLDFNSFEVYCAFDELNTMIGFLGVAKNKLEMLFLAPDQIGKGVGKKLMQFAFDNLEVTHVDVNEDNSFAVAFYSKCGFKPYDRLAVDDNGKPYPILKMKI